VIHPNNPFATPESARSNVRRLRGRLAQTVTLWTAPGPAGLTVSSCLIGDGEPGRVLGLIDDESTLWEAISATGVFAVTLLRPGQQQLADRFAGLLPAPAGLFKQGESWQESSYGPVLSQTWAGCRLEGSKSFGWAQLVEGTIEEISLGEEGTPLLHHRGSYAQLRDR
jgi:3-hydroxy-9,10-secoandrosta-1,3,5(10)-triene-9,17-dione monooxygenase reductase component